MTPATKPQLYENYDGAVRDQLVHRLRYSAGTSTPRPILHVFATPERAFAQVRRKLEQRPSARPDAQDAFPLPFASIDRLSEKFIATRATRGKLPRLYEDEVAKKYYGTAWPIPMDLTYQVSLWAKEVEDLNDLLVQWMLMFDHTPRKYLTVEHPFPVGSLIVPVTVTEIYTAPAFPEVEKQRVVRRVITVLVEGWIARAVERYGIVEKVITEYYDSDDLIHEKEHIGHVVVTENGREPSAFEPEG